MKTIGTNSIRVYHVVANRTHTDCMKAFADAGSMYTCRRHGIVRVAEKPLQNFAIAIQQVQSAVTA